MQPEIQHINKVMSDMDLQLDGKTALITGSSKGIGEAIAKGLAREGAIVVIHGRDQI
jgi:3-oxoacyl-[acyl-carrier protein] reductase